MSMRLLDLIVARQRRHRGFAFRKALVGVYLMTLLAHEQNDERECALVCVLDEI